MRFVRSGLIWNFSLSDSSLNGKYKMCPGGHVSVQSGKTSTCAVESARCALGLDPYRKYRPDGTLVVVAQDADTLGNSVYKRLFREGTFSIIRDEHTRLWRTARPWQEYDAAYKEKWRLSDPLIPERYIKDMAWIARNKEQPAMAKIETKQSRYDILFFTSGSRPKVGLSASTVWIDEECENPRWPIEMRARLVDTSGCLYWSATPEHSTTLLADWYAKAMESADAEEKARASWLKGGKAVAMPGARFSAFTINTSKNPHKDKNAIADLADGLSKEDYEVKIQGKFSLSSQVVFSDFDPNFSLIPPFKIPDHWTRYLSIDPGWNPTTVLWMAVPPPAPKTAMAGDAFDVFHAGKVFLYRELIINNAGAEEMAKRIKEIQGGEQIERFLLDFQFARQHEHGVGETRLDQYERAFEEVGLESLKQGPRFTPGSNRPEVRREAIHRLIKNARLQLFKGSCPTLEDDFRRHHFIRDRKGNITDKASNSGAIDCLGYLAEYDPPWKPPAQRKESTKLTIMQRLAKKKSRANKGISLGPGGVKP